MHTARAIHTNQSLEVTLQTQKKKEKDLDCHIGRKGEFLEINQTSDNSEEVDEIDQKVKDHPDMQICVASSIFYQ